MLKFLLNSRILLPLLVISTLTLLLTYALDQNEIKRLKSNPSIVAQQEAKDLVFKVGQLVALPDNEQPTIATVTDVSKLKGQAFFQKAQNGDKVLIYAQAKKAYLYSVKLNKILEVAPVNIGASAGQVAGTETSPTPSPKK